MNTGEKIARFYTAMTVGVVGVVMLVFYLLVSGYINRVSYARLSGAAGSVFAQDLPEAGPDMDIRVYPMPGVEEEVQLFLPETLSDRQIKRLDAGEEVRFSRRGKLGVIRRGERSGKEVIVVVESDDLYGKDLRKYMAFLSLLMFTLSALLLWLVGKFYASRMVDRLEAAYKSEKDFISNASHEINNPLTAIQGECEITLLRERTPSEYQAAIKRIASETKRIILLMKHLLFLSHGNKEILRSAVESVMLAEFLMQFVENRVRFSPDSFGFGIRVNPHLFKIAISNLVDNALKYSGEEVVNIRLRSHVLEIEDKGIGIPEEEMERIFQPFYRAANTRGYAGHGIGLSLSVSILQTYGATVEVFSKVGEGTRIRITF